MWESRLAAEVGAEGCGAKDGRAKGPRPLTVIRLFSLQDLPGEIGDSHDSTHASSTDDAFVPHLPSIPGDR